MNKVEELVMNAIENLKQSENYKNGERDVSILVPIPKGVKVSIPNIPLDNVKIEYIKRWKIADPQTGETVFECDENISVCRITGRLR